MSKAKLYVLEGFDRTGKDTQLENFESSDSNLYVYIQDPNRNPPDYRENNGETFLRWLKSYLIKQAIKLIDLSKSNRKILMTRLFISDYVYSTLFNRECVIKYFKDVYEDYFDIINIILLWDSYNDYLERCKSSNSEVEYTEEEFNKIQNLYKDFAQDQDSIIYIKSSDSEEKIKKLIEAIIYGE